MEAYPQLPWIAINLDTRCDRWKLLCESFPDQQIERFNALCEHDPEIACRKSHLAVVQLAKERNYPWVAVLEDDCVPYPEFHTEFNHILSYLWMNRTKWEIYNGGPIVRNISQFDKLHKILKIDEWIAAQFLIINASAYDKVLAYNPDIDAKKIDEYYSSKCITITSSPMLTYQRNMYSDLAKEYTNNEHLFNLSRRTLHFFFS